MANEAPGFGQTDQAYPIEQAYGGSRLPVPPTLPQRIPSAPDVPDVPDDGPDYDDDFIEQGPAPAAELARIATRLRNGEQPEEESAERPDGFDVNAVLAAVRGVQGVRDAQLRPNPGGVHTLRLDLADGADPGSVSRLVARLLKQKMGLAAEPRRQPAGTPTPNLGQPHRDTAAMPVAGTAPAPRIPIPATAAEQLGGPAAANVLAMSDERPRRRHAAMPVEREPEPEPRRIPRRSPGVRVIIDQVQVSTLGLDATVEVRLTSGGLPAIGIASGPSVDGYVLRMAAVAAASAIDQMLAEMNAWEQPGRCFVEHAAVVPFGGAEVAVVVVLLVCGGVAEQLSGSALVSGDPRQAVVRATLSAVNRRLDALLG
jgi:hypothetical protein